MPREDRAAGTALVENAIRTFPDFVARMRRSAVQSSGRGLGEAGPPPSHNPMHMPEIPGTTRHPLGQAGRCRNMGPVPDAFFPAQQKACRSALADRTHAPGREEGSADGVKGGGVQGGGCGGDPPRPGDTELLEALPKLTCAEGARENF